jgi:hypothetical protein
VPAQGSLRKKTSDPLQRGIEHTQLGQGPALLLVPSAARCCPRRASPVPPTTGVPMALDLDSWICQPFQKNKNSALFQFPQTFRWFVGTSSATRGRPDTRFCVCGRPRGDLSPFATNCGDTPLPTRRLRPTIHPTRRSPHATTPPRDTTQRLTFIGN